VTSVICQARTRRISHAFRRLSFEPERSTSPRPRRIAIVLLCRRPTMGHAGAPDAESWPHVVRDWIAFSSTDRRIRSQRQSRSRPHGSMQQRACGVLHQQGVDVTEEVVGNSRRRIHRRAQIGTAILSASRTASRTMGRATPSRIAETPQVQTPDNPHLDRPSHGSVHHEATPDSHEVGFDR